MRYATYSALDAYRDGVDLACEDDGLLRSTLAPLGAAVRAAARRCDEAARRVPEGERDIFVDDECALIENLLGAAYVTCQARITAVASAVTKLARHVDRHDADALTARLPRDKSEVLGLGRRLSLVPTLSEVQALDALANYFKHHEQWEDQVRWHRLGRDDARRTVAVISQLGLRPSSTGNLRRGAQALGSSDYRVNVFAEAIDDWCAVIKTAVRDCFQR